ncbi:MAG: hypothetical protein KBT12_03270 [Bacteroidales bacterium]|nr:hypothetical protein [Candidatus Physcousia equi]
MITVANPIYDAVFKYLVEDARVARTLLSALLKKEVVEVEFRRHEYSNGARDKISMFRIDFAAQVRQEDGTTKLVLIELQKTWLETETLRFRQYLATQYASAENILKDTNSVEYGIPMVTVYLLGHRLGDIDVPVLYVNHDSFDYDGNKVTKGIPDPFVESLVHDSIIVQIPLLHGRVNNRLDAVLSVFDQTQKDRNNRQVLNIDESHYDGDEDMQHLLRRLLSAASDVKVRQDMNVEEEYFLAIENRDTAIMIRDAKIKELDSALAEKDSALAEKDSALAEKDSALAEKDSALAEKDSALAEKDSALAEKDSALAEKEAKLQRAAQLLQQAGMSEQEAAAALGL